ncbi:MAG TPA: hypothetical protein VGD08_00155 [Stellaceae bacterium]
MNRSILPVRRHCRPILAAVAAAVALTCQGAAPAPAAVAAESAKTPIETEQDKLAGYFKTLADAYGLTAELERRCKTAPKVVAEMRDNLLKSGQTLQREARTKVSLKDIAATGFDNGMKRGRDLDCTDESFALAHDARQLMTMRVNETIARINDLFRQQKQQNSPAAPKR